MKADYSQYQNVKGQFNIFDLPQYYRERKLLKKPKSDKTKKFRVLS